MATLLVIDDDDALLEALRQILERADHRVTLARNGREGYQRFTADRFDLVITDILMPEQEGLETINQLRQAAPDLPILAISGGGAAMEAQFTLTLASRLGAVRTLVKPFTRQELLDAVEALLPDPSRTRTG